jgi:hypothetical protein
MPYAGCFNRTGFAAEVVPLHDEEGRDVLTCIVHAGFDLTGGEPIPIPEPPAILFEGEHHGDPASTSLKFEPQVAYTKQATDVALVGHAHAEEAVESLDVSLSVGPVRKTVRVFGDRIWKRGIVSWRPSRPAPFRRMPLQYELAFGGWDRSHPDEQLHEYEPRNPVGRGFCARRRARGTEPGPLPNLEDPHQLIRKVHDRPNPAGFGFIAPSWEPRRRNAGTYDASWVRDRMPTLPRDFRLAFFNAAHPDLIAAGFLEGGEPVEIVNASPRGPLRFSLPVLRFEFVLRDGEVVTRHPMNLDTIVVDADADRLYMTWRAFCRFQRPIDWDTLLWTKAQRLERSERG